jgi:glucan phosphoethanolaminetransferase (alkaline phosphatase superfamily)
MILKRLIIVNSIISTLIIIFFYFHFNLLKRTIFYHAVVIGYIASLLYYGGNIVCFILQEKLARIAISILFIFTHLFLVGIYLGYYFGMEDWGYPLSVDVFKVYIHEATNLLDSLPFEVEKLTFYTFTGLLVAVISLPTILVQENLFLDFKKTNISFFTWVNKTVFILIFLVVPIAFIKSKKLQTTISFQEPIGSFFFYDFVLQQEKMKNQGIENLIEKDHYPINMTFNKKNVILIICDALRADHISSNQYHRKTTPFLDSIANTADCVVINNYFSTSSRSFIGITNTLSSNYFVARHNFFIHDLLKKQGYQINFILGGDHTHFYGLKSYFGNNIDNYFDGWSASKLDTDVSINDDKRVVIDKLSKIPNDVGKPSFFYLHFMSTHETGIMNSIFKKFEPNKYDVFEDSISTTTLTNDYDNRMSQLDAYLNQAISLLKVKGYLENSILIITADHGQSLGEKGLVGHTKSTYLSEVAIPLYLIQSGTNRKRINKMPPIVNQLDIAPTIVDLLDIPAPATWNGFSIFKERTDPFIYQQEKEYFSCIWVADNIRYQYLFNSNTKREELYNIDLDKAQNNNLMLRFDSKKLHFAKAKMEKFFSKKLE